MTCDAVFGAGSENFGTVTGNVTFQDGSANSGTVTGNAVFEGTAENKAGATVTGDATFASTAVNNGTVTGAVTVEGAEQAAYATWLAANVGVNQYTVAGYKNGQWAFDQTEYATQAEADFAALGVLMAQQGVYNLWIASNSGLNQYTATGYKNGQWVYNQQEYPSQADAEAAAYAAWLAANTGVAQYTGSGSKNGQWVYNSTEQVGQNSAIAAQSNALYPGWLSANTGVNQYQGLYGDKYGQWAWNQTEYPGEAQANEAQTLHFAGFVSETTDIRQYLVAGANYGKWAYNSTEMTLNPANISSAPQYWNDTTYSFGDVVVNASRQIWVCVSASPVDSNFSTPGTSSDWVQIA